LVPLGGNEVDQRARPVCLTFCARVLDGIHQPHLRRRSHVIRAAVLEERRIVAGDRHVTSANMEEAHVIDEQERDRFRSLPSRRYLDTNPPAILRR
jgi:hypothetical protein